MKYLFVLGDEVILEQSREKGVVIGRAEYQSSNEPCYYLRYVAADGRLVENWWYESALDYLVMPVDE